jgi:hypothetical protein
MENAPHVTIDAPTVQLPTHAPVVRMPTETSRIIVVAIKATLIMGRPPVSCVVSIVRAVRVRLQTVLRAKASKTSLWLLIISVSVTLASTL